MKNRLLLLCLFLSCMSAVSAQQGTIKGIVIDSLKAEPVEFASARLFTATDTTFIRGATTDEKGRFSIKANSGKYLLEISFVGYKTWQKNIATSNEKPDVNLGTLFMYEDTQNLDQVVITATIPDMEVKGDTIVYNASAYMSDENDMLQDIIKNMPGVRLDDDGNLTINGKVVTKILIDGKEFFNNDIKMALRNLPANMIKKIQLFQEQSEQSKTSGIKDDDGEQVLNLEVKEEFKQSIFGDATVGYGNHDRYLAKVTANTLRGDKQLSVLAGGNNLNEGIENAGTFGRSFNYFSPSGQGVDERKEAAVNFSTQKSDTFKINGNIRYATNSNLLENYSRTETIDPDNGNNMSIQDSRSKNDRRNLNFDFNFSWHPDSLTNVYFRSSGGYSENKDKRNSDFSAFYVNDADTINHGWTDYHTKGNGKNLSGSLSAGRKLNSKGRNISLYLNGSIRNAQSDGENKSLTIYSDEDIEDKIIDQKLDRDNTSKSFGISVSYVEPITDKNSLNITYSYNENRSDNVNDAYIQDPLTGEYTVLDSLYARTSKNFSRSQRIELGFQALHEKYEYNIGFSASPYDSHNKTTFKESIIDDLKQNVVNYSPRIRFKYKKDKNTSFNLNYQGRTSHPTNRQLSADTTIWSSSNKEYGNPNLKPSFENRLDINYQNSNHEKERFIYIRATYNNTINQIVNYSVIDKQLNRENTYRNVNGDWGGDLSIMFHTPLKKEKLTINTYSYAGYNRRKTFINTNENVSNRTNLSKNVMFSFRSKKIDVRLNIYGGYNITKNSLENQHNIETGNLRISNSFNLKLPLSFQLQNEISYSKNYGYSSDIKSSEIMWNASLSKSFLKKKVATLRLNLYDILRDQNTNARYVAGEYIVDNRSNFIKRNFMLNFTYRFNITKGGNKEESISYDY